MAYMVTWRKSLNKIQFAYSKNYGRSNMSKILKIEGSNVTIGMNNGEMREFALENFQYANPIVGDEVEVYQKETNGEVAVVKSGTISSTQSVGYYAKEKRINKHIFVWVGTFLFGTIGVDRFMRGQVVIGILKLLTLGAYGIWTLIDWIIALTKCYGAAFKNDEDVTFINGKYGR